jgi:SAM-dependent methyltransferase
MARSNFDRIARLYRWLEYVSFGPMLERCRFWRISELADARGALILGDGDGRFLALLLAANPLLEADVVDQSAGMLRLLEKRVAIAGAQERVRTYEVDALEYQICGTYDLVVTHFFLDCFSTEDVRALAKKFRPHLSKDALWVVSEFAVPRGMASLPARAIVAGLYAAFRVITGLRVQKLPDYAGAFAEAGLVLEKRRNFLAGLLVNEIWRPNLLADALDKTE